MLIRLLSDSPDPMYVQIARAITEQIEEGEVGAGDRLPAARSLADSLGVNIHTVLKAYSELESAGLVEMRRGRGGVVVLSEPRIESLVRDLVATAKDKNISRTQLIKLLEESW